MHVRREGGGEIGQNPNIPVAIPDNNNQQPDVDDLDQKHADVVAPPVSDELKAIASTRALVHTWDDDALQTQWQNFSKHYNLRMHAGSRKLHFSTFLKCDLGTIRSFVDTLEHGLAIGLWIPILENELVARGLNFLPLGVVPPQHHSAGRYENEICIHV